MQIERSPFLSLDRSQVIGYFKAAGSRDPDVLHTHKASLISLAKFPKLAGTYLMVVGGLCTLLILLAPIGLPLLGLGWWTRRRGVRNLETVESGFTEFMRGAAA
ncbi:MAG TPA: hypothetical protein VD788_00865 [Candidatus Polarisedimenticolaceae bacterium]|nr:hypothetical protein [Candidatus Polarisedimenticolaceae bacterium]